MSNLMPDSWNISSLESNAILITDGSHFSPVTFENGFPIATVQNMRSRDFDLSSCRLISKEKFNELERGNCLPLIGDVLFSKDGTIGKTFVFRQSQKVVLLSSIAIIRLQQDKLDPNYCTQYLQSSLFYKQLEDAKSGSAIKRVVLKDIKQLRLPIPPLPEQRKIAKILTSVDEVIEKTQAQIDKLKDLKTGMMQELLTNGIGHTEFKDSPVGRIPAEWEVVPLANLSAKISDGIHSTPQYTDSLGYYFINGNNLKNGKVIFSKNTKFVSNDEYIKHKKDLGKNTILMSINGTIGNLAYYEGEEVVLGKSASFISLKEEQSRSFIYYVLQSEKIKAFYDLELTGSTIRNLSLRAIKETPIVLPSPDEQTVITKVLSSIDRNLKLKSERLKILLSTKKALMQDLLTGKVRVKVDSE